MAIALLVACACAFTARADETIDTAPATLQPKVPGQWLYKGLVGNALELLPLDPERRTDLQRVNAVVGTPLSARSLAVLLGVASSALIIPGLIWGIWSALNIKEATADMKWLGSTRGRELVGFCVNAKARACDLQPRNVSLNHVDEPVGGTAEQSVAADVAPADRYVLVHQTE